MSTSFSEIASRTQLSESAVRALYEALVRGRGAQAQFNHPDLGGMGQWQRGGMVMVGDMFNKDLAAKVSQACELLADEAARAPAHPAAGANPAANWWPADFGDPSMHAAQNDIAYAYFPTSRRLALRRGGEVELFDVGDLTVSGLSAQSGTIVVHTSAGERALSDFRRVQPT